MPPKRTHRRSKLPLAILAFLSEIGRRGGITTGTSPEGKARARALGKARAKSLTADERREAAVRAVKTRWAKDTSTKADRRKAARAAARARWGKITKP